MKLNPDAKVHPEAAFYDPMREIIETGSAYMDTGGMTVREHAWLLAWQAKLIADAIRRQGTVHVEAEVRGLFGEADPVIHDWGVAQRIPASVLLEDGGYGVRCKACGCEAVSATVVSLTQKVNAINGQILEGTAAPCPGTLK